MYHVPFLGDNVLRVRENITLGLAGSARGQCSRKLHNTVGQGLAPAAIRTKYLLSLDF